jgi:hypothetical protein
MSIKKTIVEGDIEVTVEIQDRMFPDYWGSHSAKPLFIGRSESKEGDMRDIYIGMERHHGVDGTVNLFFCTKGGTKFSCGNILVINPEFGIRRFGGINIDGGQVLPMTTSKKVQFDE